MLQCRRLAYFVPTLVKCRQDVKWLRTYRNEDEGLPIQIDRESYQQSWEQRNDSFENMLRHSKFVRIGKPNGKRVIGYIKHIVGDDLYVDFDGKFYGIVKRPNKAEDGEYDVGRSVVIELKDMEVTGHFLGQSRHLTLCEADIKLVETSSSG